MRLSVICALVLSLAAGLVRAADEKAEDGFVAIFNGKDLTGWKIAERPDTFKIVDGALVAKGDRAHAFYVGDEKPFVNFELRLEVMTKPNSNGGVYFHTQYQEKGWPKYGFETQVNQTHSDWKKSGSLYDVQNVKELFVKDNEWYTHTVIVKGDKVTIKLNDKVVNEYTEPAGTQPGKDFTRKIDKGTFALQAHDPKSEVHYRNIRVKRLD
jgi:hypothetical protein